MKKILYFAAFAFLAMGMTSCDKDENGTNDGGGGGTEETSQVVTGEYIVDIDTVLDVASGTEGTSTFTVSADNGQYLVEQLLDIDGIPFIFNYSETDAALMSNGTMKYNGQEQQATGYWLGVSDEAGEITQAILFASFITQDGGMMQPIIIYTDPQTGELTEFGSNLYLLVCPAWLDENGEMQVDPNSGKVKCGITVGSKTQFVAAGASLSSVRPASQKLTLAPVAPVRATEVNF